ncbi:hypothetical protein KSB_51450 [Ktedonobacter robiniae]|uniref:Uncharacterized protein n=1 Tax=Ktedonobacter robiniae TaxID=2778365 RepID=A0ABQ3UVH4_9CHLR|nr:hypothetical protein KSB_51450 [Ktedonobacter robiniae]
MSFLLPGQASIVYNDKGKMHSKPCAIKPFCRLGNKGARLSGKRVQYLAESWSKKAGTGALANGDPSEKRRSTCPTHPSGIMAGFP